MIATHRGRFAPSPTGPLHFGSMVTAVGSWLFARAAGGRWLVRMEDLDRAREVRGAADHILMALAAFGLQSDERVLYQRTRNESYRAALTRLAAAGHAYRCHCSRSDLEPFGGIHPSSCVVAATARTPAWRLRVHDAVIGFDDMLQGPVSQDLRSDVGDFVIWRAEGGCAYQLAAVVDDARQGINTVVRGADLLESTPRQILLQRLLGFPQPKYAHLPLVLSDDGRKLSKHDAAVSVDARDPLPALRAALRFLGQTPPRATSPHALLTAAATAFDVHAIALASRLHVDHAAVRKEN